MLAAQGPRGVLGLEFMPLLPVCWSWKQELLSQRRLMIHTARVSAHSVALSDTLGWQPGCWPGGGMPMRESRGEVEAPGKAAVSM